jgi:hypothetical protein
VLPSVEVVAVWSAWVDGRGRPIATFTADCAILVELLSELSLGGPGCGHWHRRAKGDGQGRRATAKAGVAGMREVLRQCGGCMVPLKGWDMMGGWDDVCSLSVVSRCRTEEE